MADFDYTDFVEPAGADQLSRAMELGAQLLQAEARVAALEAELKEAQAEYRNLNEHVIPEFMEEVGLSGITLKTGEQMTVEEKLRGSIPESRRAEAVAWLDQNGFDKLVKREFVISFDKSDTAWARKFAADLAKRKKPVPCKEKYSVHPQTLLAWAREQLEEGTDLPLDLFGLFNQKYTKVKQPKK